MLLVTSKVVTSLTIQGEYGQESIEEVGSIFFSACR
jgi:hypothetical protein